MPNSVTIEEAANLLGINQQGLRECLKQGKFPFCTAVKRTRWSYYINRQRLYEYIGRKEPGQDA